MALALRGQPLPFIELDGLKAIVNLARLFFDDEKSRLRDAVHPISLATDRGSGLRKIIGIDLFKILAQAINRMPLHSEPIAVAHTIDGQIMPHHLTGEVDIEYAVCAEPLQNTPAFGATVLRELQWRASVSIAEGRLIFEYQLLEMSFSPQDAS